MSTVGQDHEYHVVVDINVSDEQILLRVRTDGHVECSHTREFAMGLLTGWLFTKNAVMFGENAFARTDRPPSLDAQQALDIVRNIQPWPGAPA